MFSNIQVLSDNQPKPNWQQVLEDFSQSNQSKQQQAEKGSLAACQIDYKDLHLGTKLGQGGFGIVYKGTYQFAPAAIKQLQIGNLGPEAEEEFQKEAEIMAQLRHANIVHFYGYCSVPKCLVMEYMPKGSLFSVLQDKKQALDWNIRIRIAVDMVSGLAFLHSKAILHRDIKSLNVLLDEQSKAKLTDFGLSKVKNETKSLTKTHQKSKELVGTLPWIAPELFDGEKYTYKSDIYSLGITFWELAARTIPYAEHSSEAIPVFVSRGKREDIPQDCPSKFAYLIQQCWSGNPTIRPRASEIAEFMTTDAKTLEEASNSSAALVSTFNPAAAFNLPASPVSPTAAPTARRGSGKLIIPELKAEQEISYVLEQLRTFFLEERDIGEKTENYALYNEYLKKAHNNARLVHKQNQNKHILYVNDEPLDNETAAKEVLKMLKSSATANAPQKPLPSLPPPPAVNAPPVNIPQAVSPVSSVKANPPEQKNLGSAILTQFEAFKPAPVSVNNLKAADLIEAIKQNNQSEVSRFLALKTDVSGKRFIDEVDAEHGRSPLDWAARSGYTHFIDPLVKAGADVNKPNKLSATPVYIAAQEGHASAIAALHTAGANVNTPDNDGATPVYVAAQNGHASAIAALHAAGANVNTPANDGTTPVYIAAQNGHTEAIAALIAAGANVNTPHNNGATPVYIAAQFGHTSAIAALHAAGANVNTPKNDGTTPVYVAAYKGHTEAIAALHAAGANVNTPMPDGTTPVSIAAYKGHTSAIAALIALGANVNTPHNNGATPVYIAAQNGHASAIAALHTVGANVNTPQKDGATPVYIAAYNGHTEAIAALHAAGANVNTPISDGTTPVSIAAQNGHTEALSALIAARANVNTPDKDGYTPVYVAAQEGQASAIAALHTAGANVNTPDNDGTTPVYVAAQNGHTEAIAALIAAGANVNTPANDGTTPVYIAAQNGHTEAISALIAAGANVNAPMQDSNTPLCIAASQGHKLAVIALLESGAEASVKTKYGTAIEQAKQSGHAEVVSVLEEHLLKATRGGKKLFN